MASISLVGGAYKLLLPTCCIFSKYMYLWLNVLLHVCDISVRSALVAICSLFITLCLDIFALYVLDAVHFVLSTTCGMDGLPICKVLWFVCAVWVLDSAFCVLYLDVFTTCLLYSGFCTLLPGCVYCLWVVIRC